MEIRSIIGLQEAWQRGVREYAAFLRDAKAQGLSEREIQKRGRIYLLQIDVAFAKLKTAEQQCYNAPVAYNRPTAPVQLN